jgi:serine/threonine protein kinase
MSTAYAAGIVHRALEPGNVMVSGSGQINVPDFGLAKKGGSGIEPGGLPKKRCGGGPERRGIHVLDGRYRVNRSSMLPGGSRPVPAHERNISASVPVIAVPVAVTLPMPPISQLEKAGMLSDGIA